MRKVVVVGVHLISTIICVESFAHIPSEVHGGNMQLHASSIDNLESVYQDKKALIFDIDGTLADSGRMGFEASLVVLERNSIPPITYETYESCTRYATPERMARHAGLTPDDADFESVGEALAKEFDEYYVKLVNTETAGFFPGIHDLLTKLPSHVSLGALTNACAEYAHVVLQVNCPVASSRKDSEREAAIYERFKSVRGADDVPAAKPEPDGLWTVCNDLGVKPEDCLYVGDSPTDAIAAQKAGMPAVGVLWGAHRKASLEQAPFSHLCNSVQSLQKLLPRGP